MTGSMDHHHRTARTLLNMAESAEFLSVDYDTFREYVKMGLIRAVRYPSTVAAKKGKPRRKYLFKRSTLQRFIDDNEAAVGESPAELIEESKAAAPRKYEKGWQDSFRKRTRVKLVPPPTPEPEPGAFQKGWEKGEFKTRPG